MSCRHCTKVPSTYSAVLISGNTDPAQYMERVEEIGIIPCVTAVCGDCNRISVIAYDGSCAHALGMWMKYGNFIAP